MSLFGSKKKTEASVEAKPAKKAVKAKKEVAVVGTPSVVAGRGIHADILIRPRITEKSPAMNESGNVFTFEVRANATKPMVAATVKALYKVTPTKIRMVNLPAKQVFVRGKKGQTNATKKAHVFLKKGDTINLA